MADSQRAATGDFFPLSPNFTWTYQVDSRMRALSYDMKVRVIGEKFVPALERRCLVVDEVDEIRGAGGSALPIVYYAKDGFLNRVMALDYVDGEIRAPAFGRSEEEDFLPLMLTVGSRWEGAIFPFGHIRHAMRVRQLHRSYAEPRPVAVRAGVFSGCIRVETEAHFEVEQAADKHEDDGCLTYLDWYAPDVGLIKSATIVGGSRGTQTELIELLAYDPHSQRSPHNLAPAEDITTR